jgi:hypothetical protein
LAFAIFPSLAAAQSSDLDATCETVAKNFLLTDKIAVGTVQSFPELKPPGVRMTYSTRENTAKADMTDTFECEFESSAKPHHLTRFCVSTTCYAPTGDDVDRKRRLEEMRILLERAEK